MTSNLFQLSSHRRISTPHEQSTPSPTKLSFGSWKPKLGFEHLRKSQRTPIHHRRPLKKVEEPVLPYALLKSHRKLQTPKSPVKVTTQFTRSVTPNAKSTNNVSILQSETARWVLKRKFSHQLGYVKETQRIEAENQVRLLLQLWDLDSSGTIETDEIVRGLISIGLGGSLDFTKQVALKAFDKTEKDMKLGFDDFKKLLMVEPKIKKLAEILDHHAAEFHKPNKVNLGNKKKGCLYQSFLQVGLKEYREKKNEEEKVNNMTSPIRLKGATEVKDRRRRAVIFTRSDESSPEMRAIRGVYLDSSGILSHKKLKAEIETLSKRLCRNEIISEVTKYKEQWKEYADIRDRLKFTAKIENSAKELETKYGTEGARIFETLILRVLRDPDRPIESTKLFNKLVNILLKSAKHGLSNYYKFPHAKLCVLENLMKHWWQTLNVPEGVSRIASWKDLTKFFEARKVFSEAFGLTHLAKYAGITSLNSIVTPGEFLKLFAKILLYSAMTNVVALLTQTKSKSSFLPLSLKIFSYQRALYVRSIKCHKILNNEDKEVAKSIQELHKQKFSEKTKKTVWEIENDIKREVKEYEEKTGFVSSSDSSSEDEPLVEILQKPRKTLTQELINAIKIGGSPRTSLVGDHTGVKRTSLAYNNRLSLKLLKIINE